MCALLPWQSIYKILDPHKRLLTGFISIPYLGRGWYPSFLALELRPLLLWCTAALRVQPCARGRRFSTSGHHRACLCCRTGVLGSRRGWSRGRLLLRWRTGLTCQRQGGAGVPLNQLAQHKRRLWLQPKLTCRHRHTKKHRTRILNKYMFSIKHNCMADYDSPTWTLTAELRGQRGGVWFWSLYVPARWGGWRYRCSQAWQSADGVVGSLSADWRGGLRWG